MNNTGFNDILKKSILKLDVFQKISLIDVLICLFFTIVVAMFIFYIYKVTFRGVVYSYTFNISLVLMCVLTSLIILTISSNVVLSLGMVGALSIVRFRTAIKDPLDIIFMFWSITVGIASGAGIYSVSIVGSLLVGLLLVIFSKYSINDKKYILIINYTNDANDNVNIILRKMKFGIKSKTVTKGIIELTVEIKLKTDNTAFVNELSDIEGVLNASLISFNGEYAD